MKLPSLNHDPASFAGDTVTVGWSEFVDRFAAIKPPSPLPLVVPFQASRPLPSLCYIFRIGCRSDDGGFV